MMFCGVRDSDSVTNDTFGPFANLNRWKVYDVTLFASLLLLILKKCMLLHFYVESSLYRG